MIRKEGKLGRQYRIEDGLLLCRIISISICDLWKNAIPVHRRDPRERKDNDGTFVRNSDFCMNLADLDNHRNSWIVGGISMCLSVYC
jgi:hypothetical protein